jgi:NADPH:quinone reductase-like Zn-dependent oxidoreductase
MQAARIHQFGGPEVIQVETLPKPEAAPGEVLVQVKAASVNPVDYKIRNGGYPSVSQDQLPVVLGRDIAGVVAAVGAGVTEYQPGDAVYAMLPRDRGAFAEWVSVPADDCAPKPRSLDMVKAGSVPLAALTAWQGLFDQGGLRAGQTVLIHGASGGVGHFAVQFAHAKGATVFATASESNRAFVEGLGADRVIDYHAEKFEQIVRNADLVYDLIGGETQDRSWGVLKRGGTLVSTVQDPDQGRAQASGAKALRYMAEPNGAELVEIAGLIDAGKVKVAIDQVYALEDVAEAERHLEQDHVTGKVVLAVAA